MTDHTDSRLEKKIRRLGNVLFKNLLRTDTVCSPITSFGGTGGRRQNDRRSRSTSIGTGTNRQVPRAGNLDKGKSHGRQTMRHRPKKIVMVHRQTGTKLPEVPASREPRVFLFSLPQKGTTLITRLESSPWNCILYS
jgi:hypothetical protein